MFQYNEYVDGVSMSNSKIFCKCKMSKISNKLALLQHKIIRKYKESSVFQTITLWMGPLIVILWIIGLIVGPILMLQDRCDDIPTVNEVVLHNPKDYCVDVKDNACRGTVTITGFFKGRCDGKNFTSASKKICYLELCIDGDGTIHVITERNYYNTDPSWIWWIFPGVLVYSWYTPLVILVFIFIRYVIHKYLVGEDEDIQKISAIMNDRYATHSWPVGEDEERDKPMGDINVPDMENVDDVDDDEVRLLEQSDYQSESNNYRPYMERMLKLAYPRNSASEEPRITYEFNEILTDDTTDGDQQDLIIPSDSELLYEGIYSTDNQ